MLLAWPYNAYFTENQNLSRFGQEGGDPEIGFDQAADIFCFSLANEIAYTIIFGQGPWSAIRTRGTANAHRESKLFGVGERDAASTRLEPGGPGSIARRQLRNRQPVGKRTIRALKARQGPAESLLRKDDRTRQVDAVCRHD